MQTKVQARAALAAADPTGRVLRWGALLILACLMAWPLASRAQAEADPPGRVGRIAEMVGSVWWFDLEQGQWSAAVRNRPLTAGDRVSTGRDALAELRIGSTTIKLAEASEVELLRLDDERVRVQLHRGSLALRLRSREVAAETAIGTDEAWLQPQRGGLYRLDREDDTTFAASWRGELRVEDDPGLAVDGGRRLQLWREGPLRALRHRWQSPADDAFAARVLREDRDDERSAATAHVSPEMTGWEDLDRHGRWEQHPEYGAIWTPLSVGSNWAPYRQGHWTWVRPWGWTWVDDAPWGFAPYHYGRWVSWRGHWRWVPGRYVARPVFAPALVAWIDGPGVGIGLRFGGPTLSWVPLAPWEPFRPYYRVSPGYHGRVNTPDHQRWRRPPGHEHGPGNQVVPGAVTVVPSDVLRPRQPVVREGREEPRPRLPDPGADRRRPAPDIHLPTAPPPGVTSTPPLARPQPVLPSPPVQPPAARPTVSPPRLPTFGDADESAARRRVRPIVGETRPEGGAQPPAPPPARLSEPMPPRTAAPAQPVPVPRAPAHAEPRPPATATATAREREREREDRREDKREEKKDESSRRPVAEPRGAPR